VLVERNYYRPVVYRNISIFSEEYSHLSPPGVMTMSSVQLGDRQMKPISRFRQRTLTREHDSSEPLPRAYRPHMSIGFFLSAGGSIACFFGSKWRHWSYVISMYSLGPSVLALRVANRLTNFDIIVCTLLAETIKFWQIYCLSQSILRHVSKIAKSDY